MTFLVNARATSSARYRSASTAARVMRGNGASGDAACAAAASPPSAASSAGPASESGRAVPRNRQATSAAAHTPGRPSAVTPRRCCDKLAEAVACGLWHFRHT